MCTIRSKYIHLRNISKFELFSVVKRAKRTIHEMATKASSKIKAAHNCRGISPFHFLSQNTYPQQVKMTAAAREDVRWMRVALSANAFSTT